MGFSAYRDAQISLHNHSEYSNLRLLDSTNKFEKMINYVANTLGQQGFALTDHDCLSGHIKYLNTVKEMKAKGKISETFKPILGNEIYLVGEEDLKYKLENKERINFYHFILIALDSEGHKQLRELSTRAWSRMFSYKGMERVPTYYSDIEEIVATNKGHIVASTACLGGELGKSILAQDYDRVEEFIKWCQDSFGTNNFFLEMQPHDDFAFDEQGNEVEHEQRIVNEYIQSLGLPTIITTDSHYLRREDRLVHEAYLKSDEDEEASSSGGRETKEFYATTYFMGIDELRERLYYLDTDFFNSCIKNSWDIKERVGEYSGLFHNQVIPEIPLPPKSEWFWSDDIMDFVEQHNFTNILTLVDSDNDYNKYLICKCFEGLDKKIPYEEWEESLARLDLEMSELIGISEAKDCVMSSYFITMQKLIDIIWDEANSITGASRGSAAGWITNYLTGITQINPLKQPMEMFHWRFIEKARPDFPDIDTDLPSHKRELVFSKVKEYLNTVGSDIVRVGTFTTESSKKAMQTACRGLGISSDIGIFLSSLIPVVRGKVRSLTKTYYGDLDEGLPPVTEFKNQVDKYEGLFETALGIEDLISGRGSHPCGVVISKDLVDSTAIMKAPSGDSVTQYDLGDCEASGLIKYDFLNTKGCAMIQLCMEMLIEYGHMDWQGSLRTTYDKYLHPEVVDMDDKRLFDNLNNGKLLKAFQYETPMGAKAISTIHPTSLAEVAVANSLMRLMSEDGEQPMEKYARYKANPNAWDDDMIDFGLTNEERQTMHDILDIEGGVCSSQELMMKMSMDKRISGFDTVLANKLRKVVAKKKIKQIGEVKELLYNSGRALGTSETMLDYVWDVQVATQLGYSFSVLHTIGYSTILMQELHLITNYPPIYWACAVLQIESGAIEMEADDDDEDDDETETKEKNTNYDVIGGAIAMLQRQGVVIDYPDINEAQNGFAPNEKDNTIIYGFKSLSGVNNKASEIIMNNRPYTSLRDFYERLCLTKHEVALKGGKTQMKALISNKQMISLIKSGAFDKLEGKPRKEIMRDYINWTTPKKANLNVKHIEDLDARGLLDERFDECMKYYNFKMYLQGGQHKQDDKVKAVKWYLLDGEDAEDTAYCVNRFFDLFPELVEGKHWKWADDVDAYGEPIWVATGGSAKGSFEYLYKQHLAPLTSFMKSEECLSAYNESLFRDVFYEFEKGTNAKWEMEAMCMYHDAHEIAHINKELYNIVDFEELDEEPEVVDWWYRKDKDTGEEIAIPKFRIDTICGTVLGRNKTKHMVSLLTESGVVNVKYYGGQFSFYDRQISVPNGNGGKRIVERSWFTRGNILLIHGIRRGDTFRPKVYKNTSYAHSTELVERVYDDGYMTLLEERYNLD